MSVTILQLQIQDTCRTNGKRQLGSQATLARCHIPCRLALGLLQPFCSQLQTWQHQHCRCKEVKQRANYVAAWRQRNAHTTQMMPRQKATPLKAQKAKRMSNA